MKFYLFLANLLFGITLLTFAVAASHSLGIIVIGKVGQTPSRLRKQLRYFILFLCISFSLFLFFDRLIGFWSKSIRFHAEVSMQDQLFPSYLGGHDIEPVVYPKEENDLERNITLFAPLLPEDSTTSLQLKQFSTMKPALRYFTHGKESPRECSDWFQTLRNLGIRIERVARTESHATTPLVICLNETWKADELKDIKQWVYDGGSLLMFGRPAPNSLESFNPVLGIESWQEADGLGSVSFIFGGPRLAGGNFSHRNRIVLGADWARLPGMPLVEVKDGVAGAFLTRPKSAHDFTEAVTSSSPLVLSEYGRGRAFWTSLPPRLYGKLDLLYTNLWNDWIGRSLAFVFELPWATVDPWKSGGKSLAALALHAEYNIFNIQNVQSVLKELSAHASAYFVLSEANLEKKVVREWEAAGNESGVSFVSHQPPVSTAYYDTYNEFEEMSSWGHPPSGAMIFTGVNASSDVLAATLSLGYRYVLGDPFSDQMTPYSLTAGNTREMLKNFQHREVVLGQPGAMQETIFPTPLGDEFQWHYSNHFEVQSILKGMDQYSHWASAPLLIKLHSQSLSKVDVFDGLVQEMKELAPRTEWKTVADLVERWELSSKIRVTTDWSDSRRSRVKVFNEGTQVVTGATIRVTASNHWEVPGSTPVDEMVIFPMMTGSSKARGVVVYEWTIPRLAAGETKEFEIPFRDLK